MYLPYHGRWLQPDPIGFAGGDVNLYRYCDNDPENLYDPNGESIHGTFENFLAGALAGGTSGAITGGILFTVVGGPELFGAGAGAGWIVGALAGGYAAVVAGGNDSDYEFDFSGSLKAGAISGAAAGLTGAALELSMAKAAIAGGVGGAATERYLDKNWTWNSVAGAGLIGAALGPLSDHEDLKTVERTMLLAESTVAGEVIMDVLQGLTGWNKDSIHPNEGASGTSEPSAPTAPESSAALGYQGTSFFESNWPDWASTNGPGWLEPTGELSLDGRTVFYPDGSTSPANYDPNWTDQGG
jgi:hypothetical protein